MFALRMCVRVWKPGEIEMDIKIEKIDKKQFRDLDENLELKKNI